MKAALAAGFVLAWSSGFIGARLGTEASGTLTLLMWRFLIAAALLIGWSTFRRRRRRLGRREAGVQAVVGLLAQGVYLGAVVFAVQLGVALGTAALIAALQPVLAAVLARPVLGERVRPTQWLGLAIGVIGVALVVGDGIAAQQVVPPWAYALPFLDMAALVAATLLDRRTALGTSVGDALTIHCTTSAVLFGALALATGNAAPPHEARFWLAVAWVIAFATLGGYGLYWLNLKHASVTRVSSLIYLTPPTTLVWAFLMFGERIGVLAGFGIAVCAVAVLLVGGQRGSDGRVAS